MKDKLNIDKYIRLINKTEDYIEMNLDKRILLSDVAKNVNFSQYHFHRIFSKYSNETLRQFVNRIKMERSAIYLALNSKISMIEVAFKYGYNSSSSYNKAFKKYYGISPTKFKKSKNGKEI